MWQVLNNAIGGGDWATDRLILDCIRAWTKGEPVRIRKPRPWQHVLDPRSGYLQLAEALFAGRSAFAKGWNFGRTLDAAWPVEKIVDGGVSSPRFPPAAVKARLPAFDFFVETSKQHEANLLVLDSEQAQQELRWRLQGIETTLEKTLEWYAAHRESGALLTDKRAHD
jgi:CDP-glucose 4,6-dehydratase